MQIFPSVPQTVTSRSYGVSPVLGAYGFSLRGAALALVLGTLLLSTGSCRQEADQLGIRFKMEVRNLGNGLKVVLIEDHTVPLVSYQTWFRGRFAPHQLGV
jgi:hypothetical protein